MEIGKVPIFWIILTAILGPIAGFIYYYMTKDEEPPPKQETDKVRITLIVFAWIFAIIAGFFPVYGLKLYSNILIAIYIGINAYAIYRMKINNNYTGLKALIAAFILFVILFLLSS